MDSKDFIARTFLLYGFDEKHFASLSLAQQREYEAYFAISDLPGEGGPDEHNAAEQSTPLHWSFTGGKRPSC